MSDIYFDSPSGCGKRQSYLIMKNDKLFRNEGLDVPSYQL